MNESLRLTFQGRDNQRKQRTQHILLPTRPLRLRQQRSQPWTGQVQPVLGFLGAPWGSGFH